MKTSTASEPAPSPLSATSSHASLHQRQLLLALIMHSECQSEIAVNAGDEPCGGVQAGCKTYFYLWSLGLHLFLKGISGCELRAVRVAG